MKKLTRKSFLLGGAICMLSLNVLSAKAQVFVTPTLSDNFLTNVTTSVGGTPASCPDDVTINCDMLSDGHANPIKGIAWDEGTRSMRGHVYFEDGQGNNVFLQFNGVHPDIVLGNSHEQDVDYRAAVVYIRGGGTNNYPFIDFYDLTGVNTPGFTATLISTVQLSTFPYGTIYDTGPIPHIDMWSDNTPGATVNGYPGMWEFAVTWNEQNDVWYNWGNIASGTLYDIMRQVKNNGNNKHYTDVACYTDITTGDRYAAFSYIEGPNVVVEEMNFNTPLPYSLITYTFIQGLNSNYFPRIEAMSQYDPSSFASPWLAVVSHNAWCFVYNRVTVTPPPGIDISSALLAGGNFKSIAVAAGLGNVPGEPTIGNIQFTPGYFEWSSWAGTPPTYYARAVDAVSGTVTDPDYYIINTNPVTGGPPYCGADVSKSLALSNCSNSGDYLLSVWYDDANGGAFGATGDIFYKLSGNTIPMQFRIGQVNNPPDQIGIYPNPARDKIFLNNVSGSYSIYNVTGMKVSTGLLNTGSIDVATLPAGMYLLKADGKTYKFTKL